MSDKELIEKIEDAYRRVRKIGPDAIYETELREVLRAAADALEARQPREDDREALVRVVANHPIAPLMRLGGDAGYPLADAILAAGFSRAAVPDDATRELTEAIRLTVEYVGNDMLPAIEGWDWYDALVKYAPEVAQAFVDKPIHFPKSAERDAALAAIERVRETLMLHNPNGRLVKEVLAALDGAPEPEWEYGSGPEDALDQSGLHTSRATAERGVVEWNEFTQRSERMGGRPLERLVLVRRRKAGPWLPVEGESSDA